MSFPRRPETLHVHLGAHKTATTHLQRWLARNHAALETAGAWCWGPPQTRHRWIRRVRRAAMGETRKRGLLALERWCGWGSPAPLWLISEELLAGLLSEALKGPRRYPLADACLRTLLDVYRPRTVRVFLAVRGPTDFLRSLYLESLRHRPYRPFHRVVRLDHLEPHRWSELVGRLAAVVGPEQVTLWRHEDVHGQLRQVLSALTGERSERIDASFAPGKVTRPSLSGRAVQELARRPPASGKAARRAQIQSLLARYPSGTAHPPFQPWSREDRARLQRHYEEDLAEIRQRFPGVRWLTGPARQEAA